MRSKLKVKKVTSSHKKGETVIISEGELDDKLPGADQDLAGSTGCDDDESHVAAHRLMRSAVLFLVEH